MQSSWLALSEVFPRGVRFGDVAVAAVAGYAASLVAKVLIMNRHTNPLVYYSPPPPGWLNRLFLANFMDVFAGEAGGGTLAHCRNAQKAGKKAICTRVTWLSSSLEPTDPRDVEYMLLTNGLNYTKHKITYEVAKLILGDHGLVTIVDETYHTTARRAVNPSFSAAAVKKIGDSVIPHHVQRVIAAIEAASQKAGGASTLSVPKDLGEDFDHMALDIVSEAAFHDTKVASNRNISDMFRAVTHTLMKNFIVFLPGSEYFARGARRTLFEKREEIFDVCREILASRKADVARGAADGVVNDRQLIVDYLLTDPTLTPDIIASHTLTFLFAGHETTATVLNWASYLLATHPQIQEALYEELSAVVPYKGVPEHDSLSDCNLLTGVINEALRLYTPVVGPLRTCQADDVLPSGLVILAGTDVNLPVFTMHRNVEAWGEDADSFNPSRWDDPERMARIGPGAFLPFLHGKRNCIGKEFALMELRVTLAAMIRSVEVSLPPTAPKPVRKMFLTMRSESPIPFLVRLRGK